MTGETKPNSIEGITDAIRSARESTSIAVNLDPQTRRDTMIADGLGTITALADNHLRRRCLVHYPHGASGRRQVRADLFSSEIAAMGWEVVTSQHCPPLDLIVIDDKFGHAVFNDGEIVATTALGFSEQITPILRTLFTDLWRIGSADAKGAQLVFTDSPQRVLKAPPPRLIGALSSHWDRIITELARSPHDLYRMDPRSFEELIAELLRRDGMQGQVTSCTRDGRS